MQPVPMPMVQVPAGTCYFIRTIRPVLPEGEAPRSGFIPLQAHVAGTVRGTDCANGQLQPLVPTQDQKKPTEPGLIPVGTEPAR
jgi:hypothetical protein